MALQALPLRGGVRFLRLAHPGVQVPGGTRRQSTSDTLPTPQTASQSAIGLSPMVQSIGQPRLGVLPSLQKQIVSDSTGAVVVVVVGVSGQRALHPTSPKVGSPWHTVPSGHKSQLSTI